MKKLILIAMLFVLPALGQAATQIGGSNVWTDGTNVGINNSNPTKNLDVIGDVRTDANFIGDGHLLTNLPAATVPFSIANGVSHSLVNATNATGFQVSATKPAMVAYTASISTTASIGGAAKGEVYLETASTNSTTPSDWTMASKIVNGQSYTLAIALQGVQDTAQPLFAMVPAGYYTRIRTNNVSGSPSYAYVAGQETVIG